MPCGRSLARTYLRDCHRAVTLLPRHGCTLTPLDGPRLLLSGPSGRYSLHLVLVTETYSPEINGVAMTLGHLVQGLAARGHHVAVCRPRQLSEKKAAAVQIDGPVTQILLPGLPIPGYPLLRFGLPARRRLLQLWREDRPDLVHVATEGPLGHSALLAAEQMRLPVTSSFHTNFHQYARKYRIGWLHRAVAGWLRHVHNRTLRTFAPTPKLCAELAADGYRNLRVLSRGVDTALFSPARRDPALRQKWGAAPDDPVLIHAGRVAAEKNYPLLFRAYAAARAANPRLRFVLVGDGPLRAKYQAAHPECLFTGFVERRELARHYASADLYLHASVTETYGNVAAEALASGLALAGYDYAAAHELVRPGDNGLLAPLGDESAFVRAALQLATDPRLVARLRAAAPAAVRSRSWDAIIAGFEQDLAEAMTEFATASAFVSQNRKLSTLPPLAS